VGTEAGHDGAGRGWRGEGTGQALKEVDSTPLLVERQRLTESVSLGDDDDERKRHWIGRMVRRAMPWVPRSEGRYSRCQADSEKRQDQATTRPCSIP
jgi:hypothetical protein